MIPILNSIFQDRMQTALFVGSLAAIVLVVVRKMPRWVWPVLWTIPQLMILSAITGAFLWAVNAISPLLAEEPRNWLWRVTAFWMVGALLWLTRIVVKAVPRQRPSSQQKRRAKSSKSKSKLKAQRA